MKEGEHSGLGIKWYYLLKENSIYLPTPSPKPSIHDTILYLTREIKFLDVCCYENCPQENMKIHVSSQVLVISLPYVELQ